MFTISTPQNRAFAGQHAHIRQLTLQLYMANLMVNWLNTAALIHALAGGLAQRTEQVAMPVIEAAPPKNNAVSGLLKTDEEVPKQEEAWTVNLALLRDAYTRCKNPALKKRIAFLASNYLGKAAPIDLQRLGSHRDAFAPMFQVSPFNDYHYHRCGFRDHEKYSKLYNERFANSESSPLVLTNTDEFAELLPVAFEVLDGEKSAEWETQIANWLKQQHARGLSKAARPQLMLDVTKKFAQSIRTNGDDQKEAQFNAQLEQFKLQFGTVIDRAVKRVVQEDPSLAGKEELLTGYIKENSTTITRVKIEDFGGVKILPLYKELKGNNWLKQHSMFNFFLGRVGLFLGAVQLRRHVFDGIEKRPDVEYAPQGKPGAIYFKERMDFTQLRLFERLQERFASASDPVKTMGSGTLKLVHGLLAELSDERWKELHTDPVQAELIQTSLFKLREHLANAELKQNDFKQFAQEIELAHAEIASLLELTRPFGSKSFEPIMMQSLKGIPESLRPLASARLGVSGSNIYAALNAAIFKTHKQPVRATSDDFYFEQKFLVGSQGKTHHFANVMKNKKTDEMHLLSVQTHPNISTSKKKSHYKKFDIIKSIERVLKEKKKTKHLTVAIDCTIDTISSDVMRGVLKRFEKEILDGRLNIVAFRSGQKFDMFGMDNYYGGHFFMVNNRGPQWKEMNDMLLTDKPLMRTDELSKQWFSLSHRYAPKEQEAYRNAIFKTCHTLQAKVPTRLRKSRQKGADAIWIPSLAKDTNSCFIDIKVSGKNHTKRAEELMKRLRDKARDADIKIQDRSSIGFYHLSYDIIPDGHQNTTSIRLKPGIDPKEVPMLTEFLQNIDLQDVTQDKIGALIAEFSQQKGKSFREFLVARGYRTELNGINFDLDQLTTKPATSEDPYPRRGLGTLQNRDWSGLKFRNCTFDWVNLSLAKMHGCRFDGCSFKHATFKDTDIQRSRFVQCNLDDSNFNQAHVKASQLIDCSAEFATWNDARMRAVDVTRCQLQGCSFLGAEATGVHLHSSDLSDSLIGSLAEACTADDATLATLERKKPATAMLWNPRWPGNSGFKVLESLKQKQVVPVKVDFHTRKNNKVLNREVDALFTAIETKRDNDLSIGQQLVRLVRENPKAYPETAAVIQKARGLVESVDSILLPGGADLEPEFYGVTREDAAAGASFRLPSYAGDYTRSILEMGMLYWATELGKPVAGICRGAQVANVYFGGTLNPDEAGHYSVVQDVKKQANATSGQIAGSLSREVFPAYSYHHQSIRDTADTLDTVITRGKTPKALEGTQHLPITLFQFHPEYRSYEHEGVVSANRDELGSENNDLFDVIVGNAQASFAKAQRSEGLLAELKQHRKQLRSTN